MRCVKVRSSRSSIRLNLLDRTRILARDAATASLTSRITNRCSSMRPAAIIMKSPVIASTQSFQLLKIAEADFPTRFGHFRIHGYEGHSAGNVEEAVVL